MTAIEASDTTLAMRIANMKMYAKPGVMCVCVCVCVCVCNVCVRARVFVRVHMCFVLGYMRIPTPEA